MAMVLAHSLSCVTSAVAARGCLRSTRQPLLTTLTCSIRCATKLVDRGEGATYSRHLVDKRVVHVVAGNGGHGGFTYTKHKKQHMIGPGWPCGGSGGKGGDVYVKTTGSRHTLAHISGVAQAEDGGGGKKQRLNGASGMDAVISAPRGVIVRELHPNPEYDTYTNNEHDDCPRFFPGQVIADLDSPNQSVLVAHGGKGGRGNNMAKPHEAEHGELGEGRHIELELKTVADIGLIGLPNAGKSSLLSAISRASPRIAPYPFTTIAPYVGTAEFSDGSYLSIADVPGLVEGAHLGEGLGHDFLRHLERTSVLLYVIDCACSIDPFEDFLCLQREVSNYSFEMANKPCGIVANKCDLRPEVSLQRADALYHVVKHCQQEAGGNLPLFVHATSARFAEGIQGLLRELRLLQAGNHPEWLARVVRMQSAATHVSAGAKILDQA